jgi:hypothetical protein
MAGGGFDMTKTKKDTLKAIRDLGLTARYQPEYGEWRINYKQTDERWTEDSAYYTTWDDDALKTAQFMAEGQNLNRR